MNSNLQVQLRKMKQTGSNTDFSRQMCQHGRDMAELGRLMGEAGRQIRQDIRRRTNANRNRQIGQRSVLIGQPMINISNAYVNCTVTNYNCSLGPMRVHGMKKRQHRFNPLIGWGHRLNEAGRQMNRVNSVRMANEANHRLPPVPVGQPTGDAGNALTICSAGSIRPIGGPGTSFDLTANCVQRKNKMCGAGSNYITTIDDGSRLVTKITGTRSELVTNEYGVATVAGFPIDMTIPCFTKRYEPKDGNGASHKLVLELDTSRFKGDDIRVTPEKGFVNVHIIHIEHLPNKTEIHQVYDLSCPFPENKDDDLISYFSDGEKLTIDVYIP